MMRSPNSVTFFDGSSGRGWRNVDAPSQHHERLERAEQPERRDQSCQARRISQQRHDGVRDQAEPDAREQADGNGRRARHAPVAQVVADVRGDAAERTGAEVQDTRRAVHQHDAQRDKRRECARRGAEQHEAQRLLAPQRSCEDYHDVRSSLAKSSGAVGVNGIGTCLMPPTKWGCPSRSATRSSSGIPAKTAGRPARGESSQPWVPPSASAAGADGTVGESSPRPPVRSTAATPPCADRPIHQRRASCSRSGSQLPGARPHSTTR